MKRQICFGEFKINGGWEYYTVSNGNRRVVSKAKIYPYSFEEIYIEGEEEDAWEKLLSKRFKESKSKSFYIESKSLTKILNVGESLVDKNGVIV